MAVKISTFICIEQNGINNYLKVFIFTFITNSNNLHYVYNLHLIIIYIMFV